MSDKVFDSVLDVIKYSVISFFIVKFITLAYVFSHNIIECEQWSYTLIWSMWGVEVTDFFSSLVFAPIFETAIFCVILSSLLITYFANKWIFIILSASTFAPYHLLLIPGTGYFTLIYTFSLGLLLAFLFWKYKQKYNAGIAFLITTITHSFYNLLASIA